MFSFDFRMAIFAKKPAIFMASLWPFNIFTYICTMFHTNIDGQNNYALMINVNWYLTKKKKKSIEHELKDKRSVCIDGPRPCF